MFRFGLFVPPATLVLQEDVVKITEKCGLSSTGSNSPVSTPLRTPDDLKSNILKAQAEAAALKVRNTPPKTERNHQISVSKDIYLDIFAHIIEL